MCSHAALLLSPRTRTKQLYAEEEWNLPVSGVVVLFKKVGEQGLMVLLK